MFNYLSVITGQRWEAFVKACRGNLIASKDSCKFQQIATIRLYTFPT